MEQWKKVWSYTPIVWGISVGTVEDLTQKIHIRTNARGKGLQIQFVNYENPNTLILEQVTVGTCSGKGQLITNIRPVTCKGQTQIAIPAGGCFYSDPVEYSFTEKEELVISVYVKEKQEIYSAVQTSSARIWQSAFYKGNQCDTTEETNAIPNNEDHPFYDENENPGNTAFAVCGVKALTEEEILTIHCFGDSITHMSYYFDALAERLFAQYPGQIALLNSGIGGNRVLYDGNFPSVPENGKCFGKAALTRFDQDVYGEEAPDLLFIMEGVNDCCHGLGNGYEYEVPTGQEVYDGIMQLAEKAKAKDTSVYLCTVLPFNYYETVGKERAEEIRQELNRLIRSSKDKVSGIVDGDAKVRRPEDPHMMKEGLHLGDGLHPNYAGGEQIAEEIVKVMTPELLRRLKQ
jgi:lysophospholipase L1-like esterase